MKHILKCKLFCDKIFTRKEKKQILKYDFIGLYTAWTVFRVVTQLDVKACETSMSKFLSPPPPPPPGLLSKSKKKKKKKSEY